MRHRLLAGLKPSIVLPKIESILDVSMRHRLLAGLKPAISCCSLTLVDHGLNEAPPACRIETLLIAILEQEHKGLNEAPPACRIETMVHFGALV